MELKPSRQIHRQTTWRAEGGAGNRERMGLLRRLVRQARAALIFGDDNVTDPKRPYYDSEAAAKRRAERLAKLKQALGFGTVLVVKPSDETMKRLNNELKASSAN